MCRWRSNRKEKRLDRRTLRGLEAVFWIVFALALGVGGPGLISGVPKLAVRLAGSGVPVAQARNSGRVSSLHFGSSAPAAFEPDAVAAASPSASSARSRPAVAVVIDDMGSDPALDHRAIALPPQVSLSFLPYPEATPALAREAGRAGHEILAHVPMQAEGGVSPGPMALNTENAPDENVRRLDWALWRVPGYVGINNHEGSAFTRDRQALAPVAEALYGRGIFFLDSRTTPLSQVVEVSRAFGVPSAARDVFLDDAQAPAAVEAQLRELERTARANGIAIAIGHPHKITLGVLARWCQGLRGYRLVPVSQAIRLKTEREMGVKMASSG